VGCVDPWAPLEASWWDYTPGIDTCWHWKKMCKVKEHAKEVYSTAWAWKLSPSGLCTVKHGYRWLQGEDLKVNWDKLV